MTHSRVRAGSGDAAGTFQCFARIVGTAQAQAQRGEIEQGAHP